MTTLPTLSTKVDPEVRRFLMLVREALALAGTGGGSTTTVVQQTAEAGDLPSWLYDSNPPAAPQGLTATPAFNRIILEWTGSGTISHYEIYRNAEDNQAAAVLVGTTASQVYVDGPPESQLGTTYYYWVRAISRLDVVGPFNALEGTAGRTADDPDYLLEIATQKWQAETVYAADAFVLPTRPNGKLYKVTVGGGGSSGASEPTWPTTIGQTVADGDLAWTCDSTFSFEQFFQVALVDGTPKLTLRDLFLADGIISRAKIKALAVDNAKIADLSVAKLIAGIIAVSDIFLGAESKVHLDGQNNRLLVLDASDVTRVVLGKLASGYGIEIYAADGSLILGSGGVPLAKVEGAGAFAGLSQITAANIATYIATAAIDQARIKELAVGTIQIADGAVTSAGSDIRSTTRSMADGGTQIVLGDVVLACSGFPVRLDIYFEGTDNSPTSSDADDAELRVYQNGVLVDTVAFDWPGYYSSAYYYGSYETSVVLWPTAGSKTFRVDMYALPQSGTYSYFVRNSKLYGETAKK